MMDDLQYPTVHGDLSPIVGDQGKTVPKDDTGHKGKGGRRFTVLNP